MKFDLTVTDSVEGLESFIREASTPIVIWGHTGLGKSRIVSQIIERLGGKEGRISITDIEMSDSGYREKAWEPNSTHIVWEWANVAEDSDRIKFFYESIPVNVKSTLIMLAHPYTQEVGYQLLGPQLQTICDNDFKGETVPYRAYALPESVVEQSKHVAIVPSVERWTEHMRPDFEGVVLDFIEDLFKKDESTGYKALYSFFLGKPSHKSQSYSGGLSPRSWGTIQGYINGYGSLVFRGKFEDFDPEKAASTEKWILEHLTFRDGTVSGLPQVLATVKGKKNFNFMKELEVERLWNNIEFLLKGQGIGEFRDEFESYVKGYYQ